MGASKAKTRKRVVVSGDTVVILCPLIDSCTGECTTYRKYDRLGYNILCIHPDRARGLSDDDLIRHARETGERVYTLINDYVGMVKDIRKGRNGTSRHKKGGRSSTLRQT